MKDINEIRKKILERVTNHYEDNIHPLYQNALFPQSLKPYCIFDAYIGQTELYRVSICLHAGPWSEDEPEEILSEIQPWCGTNPFHYIMLFDVMDKNMDSWIDGDLIGIDQCNGFWTFSIEDEYRDMKQTITYMLNILDGFAWKVGCRVGKNDGLLLLLKQDTCPHCGKTLWIPDSLALGIKKPEALDKKPILISLKSIHCYSDVMYNQLRNKLQESEAQVGLMSERIDNCYHVDCPSCRKTVVDYNQHDYEYYQYELGPTWFEWIELLSLPESMKLISIPDVVLTQSDADLTNSALTGADGFVCCGIYCLDEIILKNFDTTYLNEGLGWHYNIERNLNQHPAFQVLLSPCDAKYHIQLARRIHEYYSIMLLKALNNSIGASEDYDD